MAKKRPSYDVQVIAEAEKILNRTLSYQAAVAVHQLKDELNLDVEELRLIVRPVSIDQPGSYRVICTIASLVAELPVTLEVVVEPANAIKKASF